MGSVTNTTHFVSGCTTLYVRHRCVAFTKRVSERIPEENFRSKLGQRRKLRLFFWHCNAPPLASEHVVSMISVGSGSKCQTVRIGARSDKMYSLNPSTQPCVPTCMARNLGMHTFVSPYSYVPVCQWHPRWHLAPSHVTWEPRVFLFPPYILRFTFHHNLEVVCLGTVSVECQ